MTIQSKIRSSLRKLWLYSQERRDALKRAKVFTKAWKCEKCNAITDSPDVDHIIPVGSYKNGWDDLIERMFCDSDGLQVLCKKCHKEKK